jgi:protease I
MDVSKAQVAVLVEHLYQELELWHPVLRLREAGANVLLVGADTKLVYASKLGYPVRPDVSIDDVSAEDFDAVVIPGGFAPEGMRRHPAMIQFVREMDEQGRLIAAICHAGLVLASAQIARNRKLTCVVLVKDDIINAGANYVNEALVIDNNIITAQLPSDLPVFGKAIVDYLSNDAVEPRATRRLVPSDGRGASPVAYRESAKVIMGPRGRASANYTTVAIAAPDAAA